MSDVWFLITFLKNILNNNIEISSIKEADWVLGPAVATPFGLQNSDYPASWTEGKFMCIVPYPREKDNIAASLKPLSYEVGINYD